MNDIGHRTTMALRYLYQNSVDMQEATAQHIAHIGRDSYAKEYCTTTMKLARQTGQTQAIANLIPYLSGTWIVTSLNMRMIENVRDRILSLNSSGICRSTLSQTIFSDLKIEYKTLVGIDNLSHYDSRVDGVIVDGASFMKKKQIKQIYKQIVPLGCDYRCSQFILIG